MVDVRGDVLRPPHGTTPAAVKANKIQKLPKPIRNTVFNFNKLVSDLGIHANTPESRDCKDSKFIYPAAGYIMTGNLKIISDSRIHYIVSKGPKYRFPFRIDFKKMYGRNSICIK